MSTENLQFHWADYLVGATSLIISIGIGAAAFLKRKRKNLTDDYLIGSGDMNFVLVGLSIVATAMNGVFLIGVPAEIHYGGIIYSLIGIGILISVIIAAHVFVPVFRKSEYHSAYAFLEKRFDSIIPRLFASAVFSISVIFFLSVLLYAPALAFQQVTGLNIHLTQCICGLVCTLYVCIGGIRAVVWTDAFQMMVIIFGTLIIAIIGAGEVGGAGRVWEIAEQNNRLNFDITSVDPRTRHTIWTQIIGNCFVWLGLLVGNQMIIQRFKAVSSTFKAQLSLYVAVLGTWLVLALTVVSGLVMSAYFKDTDPFVCGQVKKVDQVFPRFVMIVIGKFHGLPGLYTAAVLAAALSSVSTAVNSLATVIMEDFIEPCTQRFYQRKLSANSQIWISRILSLSFGLLTIALSYLAPALGDKLIEIPVKIWGTVGAPLAGVFVLAIIFPCSNAMGAVSGLLTSLIFGFWLLIGGIWCARPPSPLTPLGTQCPSHEVASVTGVISTTSIVSTSPVPNQQPEETSKGHCDQLQDFYGISYVWYSLINMLICVIVGIVVSIISNYAKNDVRFQYSGSEFVFNYGACPCASTSCLKVCQCANQREDPENTLTEISDISSAYSVRKSSSNLELTTKGMNYPSIGKDNPAFNL